jgi:cytoskeleton protein RodZ
LAASVCRALKVDSTVILAGLPQPSQPKLDEGVIGLNAKFRATTLSSKKTMWAYLSMMPVIAFVVLVLGSIAIVLYPHAEQSPVLTMPEVSSASGSSEVLLNQKISSTPSATENRLSESKAEQTTLPAIGASAGNQEPKADTTSSLPAKAQTSLPLLPVNPAPDSLVGSGMLVLKARGASWVEVIDASDVVQLRKTLANGENVVVSGVLPLRVVLGRANLIDVLVRAKSFDVSSFSKDNVARFEVK